MNDKNENKNNKMNLSIVALRSTNDENVEQNNENISIVVEARYFDKNNTKYILYEDENSYNTIKYKNGVIKLTKTGKIETIMYFNPNETTKCTYIMPLGKLDFEIETESIEFIETQKGIVCNIKYIMIMDSDYIINCVIKMETI